MSSMSASEGRDHMRITFAINKELESYNLRHGTSTDHRSQQDGYA